MEIPLDMEVGYGKIIEVNGGIERMLWYIAWHNSKLPSMFSSNNHPNPYGIAPLEVTSARFWFFARKFSSSSVAILGWDKDAFGRDGVQMHGKLWHFVAS